MTEEYNPLKHSIVQATVGNWCQYECDDFVNALFSCVLEEIARVHWNVYQHKWGPTWHADEIEDPEITGISFTRYYDGCPCDDEDEHRPECRHVRPNFQHEDVQFRWYKYPGRGMSTNKDWSADEWRAWLNRCLATIRAFDGDHMSESDDERNTQRRESMKARFPNAYNVIVSRDEREYYRRLFDAFDQVEKAQTPCWVCSEAGIGSGGGMYESGPHGTVARTLHEDDDPQGKCVNCGHVNTDEQTANLSERRRANSDERRLDEPPSPNAEAGPVEQG